MKLLSQFMVALAALLLALPAQADKKKAAENLEDARSAPGKVTGGEHAPFITGRWLQGTHGNAGVVPAQVAKQLRGKRFNSFAEFRKAFWLAVAAVPELKKQFAPGNQGLMAKGNAPFADDTQQKNGQEQYQLHHRKPVHDSGGLYDLDNLVVVTPMFHAEVLSDLGHLTITLGGEQLPEVRHGRLATILAILVRRGATTGWRRAEGTLRSLRPRASPPG